MRTGAVVDENQMPGCNPVSRFQRHPPVDFGAVEHGSVLASEVEESPAVTVALNSQVLAREPAVVREGEFDGAGAAKRNTICFEGYIPVLSVGGEDLEFFHRAWLHFVLCYAHCRLVSPVLVTPSRQAGHNLNGYRSKPMSWFPKSNVRGRCNGRRRERCIGLYCP